MVSRTHACSSTAGHGALRASAPGSGEDTSRAIGLGGSSTGRRVSHRCSAHAAAGEAIIAGDEHPRVATDRPDLASEPTAAVASFAQGHRTGWPTRRVARALVRPRSPGLPAGPCPAAAGEGNVEGRHRAPGPPLRAPRRGAGRPGEADAPLDGPMPEVPRRLPGPSTPLHVRRPRNGMCRRRGRRSKRARSAQRRRRAGERSHRSSGVVDRASRRRGRRPTER